MIIDYIYFILIIVLICLIIFLIYLSYEYRIEESFTLPTINLSSNKNIPAIIKLETNLLNNYNQYIEETNNNQNNIQYYKNLNIYNNSLLNNNYSNNLMNNSLNLLPPSSSFPVDKPIKTIKSNYNSQYLSTFSNDVNKYGILANDKCLTVNGLCDGEFCLLDCQKKLYSSNSQKFTTDRINSASDVARIMNVNQSKISDKNIYPFNIFRSAVNNKCLTISNDGISVDRCNLNDKKQQWTISPDENICYLT